MRVRSVKVALTQLTDKAAMFILKISKKLSGNCRPRLGQGYQPSGFYPGSPNFIFPVRNKMNSQSGLQKVRKLYNLQNV
jgi:hypothetical protein